MCDDDTTDFMETVMFDDDITKQRTIEWLKQRQGKVTASHIYRIMGKSANHYNAYFYDLMEERLTDIDYEDPYLECPSPAMKWGMEQENEARQKYTSVTGLDVQECGFIDHPRISMAGASPDGLVGDRGLIEIKCPMTSTHLKLCHSENIDPRYMYQMQFQLACTERDWCDFVSYDPRLHENPNLMIKVIRVERDVEMIQKLEDRTVEFLDKLEAAIKSLEVGT